MKGIRGRFALFVAIAAIAPLLAYGFASVFSLRKATEESVADGARAVARQVAGRFGEYFENNRRILQSLGSQLTGIQLEDWQKTKTLNNQVLDSPEFRQISIVDTNGAPLLSARSEPIHVTPPGNENSRMIVQAPRLDAVGLPTTFIAVPLPSRDKQAGWTVAEISRDELW